MGKWSRVTEGKRAREAVEFVDLYGEKQAAALRILDGNDYGLVLEFATAYAKEKGAEAKAGGDLYDYAVNVKTVHIGVIDTDSAVDKPERFFNTIDDLFEALDRDRINALAQQQKLFQAVVSPFPYSFTPEEFTQHVVDMAYTEEGETHPFVSWPPDLQWTFTRTLANRCVALQMLNSATTSTGEAVASS